MQFISYVGDGAKILQKTAIMPVDYEQCSQKYRIGAFPYTVRRTQLCAVSNDSVIRDTCQVSNDSFLRIIILKVNDKDIGTDDTKECSESQLTNLSII